MPKKHAAILQELDLKDVDGFTEAQITYFTSLGLKPYQNSSGKVKWMLPEQQNLRLVKSRKSSILSRILSGTPSFNYRRRKHRSTLSKLLLHNWLWILIFLAIMGAIGLMMFFPQLILR